MKKPLATLAAAVILAATAYATPSPSDRTEEGVALKTLRDRASYGQGLRMGQDLRQAMLDLDPDVMGRGLKDGLSGANPLLTEAQVRDALGAYYEESRARHDADLKATAAGNEKAGAEFLAANKAKEGVKTTPSGLQYKMQKVGEGAQPKETDAVEVFFTGKLADGRTFDSAQEKSFIWTIRYEPPGLREALLLMKVGGEATFWIPGKDGFGMSPMPGSIVGPNALLVYEVKLKGIVPPVDPNAPTQSPDLPHHQGQRPPAGNTK